MQARSTGFSSFALALSFVLALAMQLGALSSARAEETAALVRPDRALDAAGTAAKRALLGAAPLTFGEARLPAIVVTDGAERGSNRRDSGHNPRLDLDALFRGNGALELLGAFVLPGQRGVTVATSDGVPSLSLAMMRIDITRGSGLCAMGKF